MSKFIYFKTILLLLVITIQYKLQAQIPHEPFTVPSPNASQFGRYGDVPVSLYTGAVQFDIPIHTISNGTASLPISLSYISGGVKPDEHPGWTGLGWNLNQGGVITRTVRDIEDDDLTIFNGVSKGYYSCSNILKSNNWSTSKFIVDSILSVQLEFFDTEPDEFSFNFQNYSGKFYLDEKGTFRVRSDQKMSVTLVSDVALTAPMAPPNPSCFYSMYYPKGYKSFSGFVITVEDGTQFTFGNTTDAIEYSIPFFQQYSTAWVASSWYLTKIVDPRGKEIRFNYARGPYINQMYMSAQYRENKAEGKFLSPSCYNVSGTPIEGFYSGRLVAPIYLNDISTSHEKIVFYRSTSNELTYTQDIYAKYFSYQADLYKANSSQAGHLPYQYLYFLFQEASPCSSNKTAYEILDVMKWKKLDSIKIFDYEDNPVKSFALTYNNDPDQRLMLLSVQEKSPNYRLKIPSYQFSYYSKPSTAFGTYLHYKTDHWGYSNYKEPGAIDDFQNFYKFKEPDSTYLYEGSLSRIVYPTGGVTEIEYQAHSYSKEIDSLSLANLLALPTDKIAGGLRVKRVTSYFSGNQQKSVKQYYYIKNYNPSNGITGRSSGVLSSKAKYYWTSYQTRASNDPNLTYQEKIFSIQPTFPFTQYGGGPHVTYSEVVEKDSDGSSVRYTYTHYESKDVLGGHKDQSFITTLQPSITPYEPITSLSFTRGKLLTKEIFDNNGNKLQKESNLYQRVGPVVSCRAVKANLFYTCPGKAQEVVTCTAYNNLLYPFLKYKSSNITYNPTNAQDSISQIVDYEYDNTSFQLLKATANTSNGKNKVTKYTYPFNYSSLNSMIGNLQNRSMYNSIIEKVEYVEDPATATKMITDGELSFYLDNGLKRSMNFLENQQPIVYTTFSFATVDLTTSAKNFVFDSRFKERVTYTYDPSFNLSSYKKDSLQISYIWDDSVGLPIAEVRNAKPTQIYFNNFEIDGNTTNFRTGKKSNRGNFSATPINDLSKLRGATLSYWYYTEATKVWTYYEEPYNGNNITASGKDYVDDIRVYPKNATMVSYTHRPLRGVSSRTDENNLRTLYEYDELGRLILIRDDKLNILKKYTYTYFGE